MPSPVQAPNDVVPSPVREAPDRARRALPDVIGLVVFLVLEVVFFSLASPYFLDWDNFVNILTAISITGVLACAGTLLLVSGQFDLSVGSGVAFVGVVTATAAQAYGLGTAVPLGIAAGVGIGLLNGFLVTVVRINALIATLGTLAIFRGLTLAIGKGQNISVEDLDWAARRPFLNVPMPAIVFVVMAAAAWMLMSRTVYGRKMYAIGANPVAARLVGVRVSASLFCGFALSGACIAVSGQLVLSQLGSTSATTGTGLELAVVTAVILGGTSLSGGTGSMPGTVVGLLIVGVLSNGLTLMNVDSSYQQVATGCLLVLAVAFDRARQTLTKAGDQ